MQTAAPAIAKLQYTATGLSGICTASSAGTGLGIALSSMQTAAPAIAQLQYTAILGFLDAVHRSLYYRVSE